MAEVLITLGIIGVVAALTLPSVLSNIEKKRTVTVLKRAYSDLYNYVRAFNYENDCDSNFSNCVPAEGEFVYKFTEYLYKKQHFKDGVDKSSGHNYFCYAKNSEKTAFNAKAVHTMDKHNDPSLPYDHLYTTSHYLISPTGNYGYAISKYPGDYMYRPSKGDKNDFFRAVVVIITDPKKVKPIWQCSTSAKAHIYGGTEGRNAFTASITQFNHILPNGSPLCRSNYYCNNMQENDCTKQGSYSGYSRCFQKIIEDGWEIKYDLPR